jgi:peptidoglycan/xylan/chitin deacetylase (PgdA/CDA1 family)
MDKPALISLTFDDGLRCQFERAVPILDLDQYRFPATFFLTANTAPAHVDWCGHACWRKLAWSESDIRMLRGLLQRGHEIGSHSVWHLFPEPGNPLFCPDFNPQFEVEESKRLIEGWLGEEISSFGYPFYRKPNSLKNAVIAAGYKQARAGCAKRSYSPQESIDLFDVDCVQISKNENIARWVQPGRWNILTYHGIGGDQDGWEPVTVEQFNTQMAELAKHRNSGALEIVTFKDGAGRFRPAQ